LKYGVIHKMRPGKAAWS